MVDVIDYENIENVTSEQYWQDASSANSSVPWINSPMIDAPSWVENIPEYTPEEQDITPDLTWWTTNIVRTANSYNKISWSAWTIYLADWTTYSVDLWTRTSITAITYIYYNWTSTLQTTTLPEQAVGTDKILLCVAKNVPSPNKLQFQAFWTAWLWVFITADNIASNTITANQIASNTISASQIRSDYVYTGNLNASQITAGTMSANKISWWTITGITITSSTFQTATGWQRIVIWTDNIIRFYNSVWNFWYIYWWDSPWTLTWTCVVVWWQFAVAGNFTASNIVPFSDNRYNLWASMTQRWKDIYMSWVIRHSTKLNFQSTNTPVQTANTTSNRYMSVIINWTSYKLLLAT